MCRFYSHWKKYCRKIPHWSPWLALEIIHVTFTQNNFINSVLSDRVHQSFSASTVAGYRTGLFCHQGEMTVCSSYFSSLKSSVTLYSNIFEIRKFRCIVFMDMLKLQGHILEQISYDWGKKDGKFVVVM
jgi:hypothetical protein